MDLLELLARGVLWLMAISLAVAGLVLVGAVVLDFLGVGSDEN